MREPGNDSPEFRQPDHVRLLRILFGSSLKRINQQPYGITGTLRGLSYAHNKVRQHALRVDIDRLVAFPAVLLEYADLSARQPDVASSCLC
jgi:hypothetical protein